MASSSPPLADEKKPSFGDYEAWLIQRGHVKTLDIHKSHYDVITHRVAETYRDSDFWRAILGDLKNVDARYLIDQKYPLIAEFAPAIVVKPWNSFLEKTYRKNIANNHRFPEPPEDGWLTPENWYTRIHDIVRTTIIVKYLDGVPLILEFLRTKAVQHGLQFESELEARVDGYYGAHCSCAGDCEISTLEWSTVRKRIVLEIQITTSIKDIIKRLLHSYYETRRVEIGPMSIKELSWNYKSDEFIASYLGHILHYVEGMILDVRDRKRG
jgi:ppGpp synthetase/RelA/SpoT-type nucleotidyltranferase